MHHPYIGRAARALLIAAVAASSAACATVTRGSTEDFTVQSEPSGAAVKTTAGESCAATPCTFKMSRKAEFDVTVTKTGYKPATAHVTHQISKKGGTAMVGNAIVGGLIGVGVDAVTGAANDLRPNPVVVTLEPDSVPVASADPAPTPATDAAAPAAN
jgi:hypothetical protein